MDEPETALVATSHVAGAMNYPSTTQALFALIVMIIVLLFILVYCCWGTFACARQDEAAAPTPEDAAGPNGQNGVRHILRGPHTVIVPINNMIYVGDPETHQIYQIPLDRDKPPAYTEVFRAGPPPPYRPEAEVTSSSSTTTTTTTTTPRQNDNRTMLPENPPPYDDCLSTAAEEGEGQQGSSQAASGSPQLQEVASGSQAPLATLLSSAIASHRPPPPAPDPETQNSSPSKADVVLTVSNLSEATQASSQVSAEAGPSNAPPTTFHM